MPGRPKARGDAPRAGSGLDAEGRWLPAFPGQRPPFEPGNEHAFQPGNTVALKHGARSVVQIQGRAAEVAEEIVEALRAEDLFRPMFAPTVQVCSVALVRVERAVAAIAQVDDAAETPLDSFAGERAATVERLRNDLRLWTNTALRCLAELGMTPASLARIARDSGVARATRTQAALRDLQAHLDAEHAEVEA